jgi:hypothetical protein
VTEFARGPGGACRRVTQLPTAGQGDELATAARGAPLTAHSTALSTIHRCGVMARTLLCPCHGGKALAQSVESIEQLLRDGKLTIVQIVERVPLDELDRAVDVLLAHLPLDDVCRALRLYMATAPLADFRTLTAVYRRACASPDRSS